MSLVVTDYASRRTMMVDTQVRPSDVTKFPIIDAMLKVTRESFVPENMREAAYADMEIPLGEGRVVLEPRTFARLLDALNLQPDELVLDVGCGLGYSAAILARLAETVVAVEDSAAMTNDAQSGLSRSGADNVAVVEGVLAEGAARHGPYDVILIEGGVEVVPALLLEQLSDGGRIAAVFMEGKLGTARLGRKLNGVVTWRDAFNATAPILPGFEKTRKFTL